jgi:hypothetical protein
MLLALGFRLEITFTSAPSKVACDLMMSELFPQSGVERWTGRFPSPSCSAGLFGVAGCKRSATPFSFSLILLGCGLACNRAERSLMEL